MNKNTSTGMAMLLTLVLLMAVGEAGATDAVTISEPVRKFLTETIGQPREQRLAKAAAALKETDTALAKKPLDPSYRLLKVAALGAAARASTPGESLKARYGSKSKAAVSDVLAVAPEDPWALFFAGVWHLEVDRRGGVLGAALLGGSVATGEKLIAQAMEAMPEEPSFHFAYAVVLVGTDAEKHADRVDELLETAHGLVGKAGNVDPLYTMIAAQSEKLGALVTASDYAKAKALALDLM